jgi:hypothetical protein
MNDLVVLNGVKTALDGATGKEFVCDCVRAGEGLLTDAELRDKYEITASDWKNITKNKSLIQAIRAESERRIRTGVAAQEAASKHFAKAPGYLNELMVDPKTHPKFRIESARELRTVAIGDGNKGGAPNADKFVININLGQKREHYEFATTPKELTADELEWGWRDRE